MKTYLPMLAKDPDVDVIRRHIFRNDPNREYTYIVLGRPGPTGKTTLTNDLRVLGYEAFEITEELLSCGRIEGTVNGFLINDYHKHVTIVLNKRVK